MGNDASKGIPPKDMDQLIANTAFSKEEIRDWYRKFHADCPSGQMSQPDLKSLYETIYPDGDSAAFAEQVFRVYDKDGNGAIDFKEFLSTVSITSRGSIDEKLRWAFNMHDLDGNGYVTRSEVMETFRGISKMKNGKLGNNQWNINIEEAVDELFRHLDKDGDDKLTDMEFILGAKACPSMLCLLNAENTM